MSNIYVAAANNPNTAKIVPEDSQRGAFYLDDPGFTTLWAWSVQQQAWVQASFMTTASQQVFGGVGAPTAPPPNQAATVLYVDRVTKIVYEWDTAALAWV